MKIRYSALVEAGFGRDGNLVIRDSRYGPIAVRHAVKAQVPTEGQKNAQNNLEKSSKSYSNLGEAALLAWNQYASDFSRIDPVTRRRYSPTGIAMRVELGTRFLKMNPGSALPALPPTSDFVGNQLSYTLVAMTGTLVVTGSGNTAAGTVIEVQTLRLKSAARKPGKSGYVSQGFFTLSDGDGNEALVPMTAGIYAVQVRSLRTATGQATEWEYVGKATVALSLEQGGVDEATGEVLAPVAKPARMKKAA